MFRNLLLIVIVLLAACSAPAAGPNDKNPPEPTREVEATLVTHRLPKNVAPGLVTGLEVVVKSDSAPAAEGYYVDLFAYQPPATSGGKPKWVPLGGQIVFKPLRKGESTTIVLDSPPQEAWLHRSTGDELRVAVSVKAAVPERDPPEVKLQIVEVKEVTEKNR